MKLLRGVHPLVWFKSIVGKFPLNAKHSFRQSYHGIKNLGNAKMATTDSVSVFAEGTFEDQVRVPSHVLC